MAKSQNVNYYYTTFEMIEEGGVKDLFELYYPKCGGDEFTLKLQERHWNEKLVFGIMSKMIRNIDIFKQINLY